MSRLVKIISIVSVLAAACFVEAKFSFWLNRSDRDAAMHDYLIAHPELLREMSAKLMEKDRADRQTQFLRALPEFREGFLAADQQAVSGNPKGDITIVEFYDVECPFCKALTPELDRLVKDDQFVRVVYREFPILGPVSVIGAKAEIASEKQGLYEKFHAALMADPTAEHQLDEKHIVDLAGSVGINVTQLKRDMNAPEIDQRIAANKSDAEKLAISGTPGLIFLGPGNKKNYLSVQGMRYEEMKAKLAELRLAAR